MSRAVTLVVLLVLGALVCLGCDDGTGPWRPPATSSCAHQLTYEGFGDGFVRNNCRGCHASQLVGVARHGAPDGVSFDTLDDVRAHAPRMLDRATGPAPSMPPAGGPSDEERQLFREWLACGAPSELDPQSL